MPGKHAQQQDLSSSGEGGGREAFLEEVMTALRTGESMSVLSRGDGMSLEFKEPEEVLWPLAVRCRMRGKY